MTKQRDYFKRITQAALQTVLLSLCLSTLALADIKAHLDRNIVYQGDPVILTIESDGRQSGEPDLSVLNKDFTVLSNNTSSQVRIINGRRSDKTSWSVQLEPRHLGKLQIPPISIGNHQTEAIELEVTAVPEHVAAQQSEHVFLEVEADIDGQRLYVQQQLPYTIRLYYDDHILNGDLEAPVPESAVVEQLGEDKRYTVTRNARHYNVIERHLAISAEKSGPFEIPPASFKGQLATRKESPSQGTRQGQLFDRFFRNSPFSNDPFFSSSPFVEHTRPVRVYSKAINIDVLARPALATNTWLPAEQITLHDSWTNEPPRLRAGEPVKRSITVQAKGLTGAQLPKIQLEHPERTRLYPEDPVHESRTDGDKVYGISKQNFTYIPGKAGLLTIPAVKLDWWNTRTNQAATALLPRWEFNVEPGIDGVQNPPQARPENPLQASATEPPAVDANSPPASWLDSLKILKYWTVIGAVLLFFTVVLFAAKKLRQIPPAQSVEKQHASAAVQNRTTIKALLSQLEQACAVNDARAAAHALLALGQKQWPDDPPASLGILAARLEHGHEEIMALDRALYAAGNETWTGSNLWQSTKDVSPKSATGKETTKDSLIPLYPEEI